VPVAVETLGAPGDEAIALLRDIGMQRIAVVSGKPRSHQFLMQRLNVTVQRGNVACILGTVASDLGLDDIFLFIAVKKVNLCFVQKKLKVKNSTESFARLYANID
jgi:hypothetical protein